jgi:predicted Zn-dependent peptidase
MIGLTANDVEEWPARIRAVNAAGVQAAARRLLRRNAVSVYLKPGESK